MFRKIEIGLLGITVGSLVGVLATTIAYDRIYPVATPSWTVSADASVPIGEGSTTNPKRGKVIVRTAQPVLLGWSGCGGGGVVALSIEVCKGTGASTIAVGPGIETVLELRAGFHASASYTWLLLGDEAIARGINTDALIAERP